MKDVSPFIGKAQFKFPSLFVDTLQLIDKKTRAEAAKVLGRPGIDEVVTRAVIAEQCVQSLFEIISFLLARQTYDDQF